MWAPGTWDPGNTAPSISLPPGSVPFPSTPFPRSRCSRTHFTEAHWAGHAVLNQDPRGQSPLAVGAAGDAGATAPLLGLGGGALGALSAAEALLGPRSGAEGRCLPGACRLQGCPCPHAQPGRGAWPRSRAPVPAWAACLTAGSERSTCSPPPRRLLSLGAGVLQRWGCLEEAPGGDNGPSTSRRLSGSHGLTLGLQGHRVWIFICFHWGLLHSFTADLQGIWAPSE